MEAVFMHRPKPASFEMTRRQHDNDRRRVDAPGEHEEALYAFRRFCEHADVTEGRNKLRFQPMRRHSQENLVFRQDGLTLCSVTQANVIRLGNVLLSCYYSQEEAHRALEIVAGKLAPGGIIIVATGDDHSLLFEVQGGKPILSRCTLQLRNSHINYDPGIEFPGSEGLYRAMCEALRGIQLNVHR